MISDRLEKIRAFLDEKNLDGIIVNKLENLHYFSGFTGDDTMLVIMGASAVLVTDFRYTEQAAKEAPNFEIAEQKEGLLTKVADVIRKAGMDGKRIGIEGKALVYVHFLRFQELLPKAVLVPVELDSLRQVKEAEELAKIRRAVAISDKAFEDVLTYLRPGLTEIEVAAHMENCMRMLGSERPAFATIVASGIRGSLPHGTASEKTIAPGEFVTMDFGAVYRGYHSDITRTVCIGFADEKQRNLYEVVLQSQLLGERLVRPGVGGKAVDKEVRDFLERAGYGEHFGHGLGHSLGLEIHEEPRLSPSSKCEHLEPNMLVTVEPGVYLPGWGGLRIEDTVLVTEDGCEPLTQSRKELIEL
jgi:Xaa-Pro aminopeptidase